MAKKQVKNWKWTGKGIRFYFNTPEGLIAITVSPSSFTPLKRLLPTFSSEVGKAMPDSYGKAKPIS